MLSLLISIAGILITLVFVIGTHEAGHFFTARLLGIKVLRFSLGFGKPLLQWKDKQGTEYIIALIPLGGYVKMLDENEGNVSSEEQRFAFNRQPFYKKFLVVLAGPMTNFVCAFLLYCTIFSIGFVTIKPVIGKITPNSIAAQAAVTPNQEIIAINNTPVNTWTNVLFELLTHLGNEDKLPLVTKELASQTVHTYELNLAAWRMDELKPDPLASIGMAPYEPPIPLLIGTIKPDSPAQAAGLKIGDKVLAINDQAITTWRELILFIAAHPEQKTTLQIERETKRLTLPLTIGSHSTWLTKKQGYIGIGPKVEWPKELLHTIKYNPIQSIPVAFHEVIQFSYFNFLLFGKMITGKLSLQSLGGPITIFENAGAALNSGLLTFLGFLAFLSIAVGVINLLPIPGLDGGHLLIQLIEFVIRRPLPINVVNVLFKLGFLLVFFILIQALINDILRL